MSRKAGLAIISITLTVTACLAVAMFILNPNAGEDSLGARILAEAKARQSESIITVPEPLKTDIVALTEEEKMAEKVSVILSSDEAFVADIGSQAAPVVGEKISDLEDVYSEDMIRRIDASTAEAKAYTDEKVKSDAELVQYLLGDKTFVEGLAQTVSSEEGREMSPEEVVDAVISSDKFNDALVRTIAEYLAAHPQEAVTNTIVTTVETTKPRTEHIAIPDFPVKDASEYTEEEYIEDRNEARLNEIDRILEFLGY